jgi:hypothetical protein
LASVAWFCYFQLYLSKANAGIEEEKSKGAELKVQDKDDVQQNEGESDESADFDSEEGSGEDEVSAFFILSLIGVLSWVGVLSWLLSAKNF